MPNGAGARDGVRVLVSRSTGDSYSLPECRTPKMHMRWVYVCLYVSIHAAPSVAGEVVVMCAASHAHLSGFHCVSHQPLWRLPADNMYLYTLNSVISTPHNVTYSRISWNPREQMFVVQISLLIVTFLSLVSRTLSSMQTTEEVHLHSRSAPHVNMWSFTFLLLFFLFFLCH
jgi:hypothetical protein